MKKSLASIEVKDLAMSYGAVEAVRGIDFEVKPGEIVGLLGPNGAGKSTTMKILTGYLRAGRGTARVAGFDVATEAMEVRRRVGYLPENVPLYDEMLVVDYLTFVASMREVDKKARRGQVERVASLTGIEAVLGRGIGELSKGYRQRVGLAQAIVHEPEVLILDEPTTGLDPNQIVEIRDVIKAIGEEKTVIFSTHILQEVAAVCDRIIVLNAGKIVADDALGALLEGRKGRLVVRFGSTVEGGQRFLERLKGAGRVEAMREEGGGESYEVVGGDVAVFRRALIEAEAKEGRGLVSLEAGRTSLEDLFRALTRSGEEEMPEAVEEGLMEGETSSEGGFTESEGVEEEKEVIR